MNAVLTGIPSPPQGVWYLGPLAIRAYAVFIIIGIVVGVWWGNKRLVARGGRPGRVTDIAVFMVPFGIVGGRIYHVVTDNQLYFGPGRNPWNALAIWNGGLGIWGAIALGAVGAWIGCRRYKVSFPAFADAIAPGIVTAQAIGRLGNWFNQELFGSPTTLPWGLEVFVRTPGGVAGAVPAGGLCEFPTDYVKANPEVLCGVYQPTFLYELLWNLAVAAIIVALDRRYRLGGGRVFALYVAGYTLGRTWIEMLRIDPANTFLGLRINVFTSVIVFIAAVVFLVLRRNVGREDPAVVRGIGPDDADPDDAHPDGAHPDDVHPDDTDDAHPDDADGTDDMPGTGRTARSDDHAPPHHGGSPAVAAGRTADDNGDAAEGPGVPAGRARTGLGSGGGLGSAPADEHRAGGGTGTSLDPSGTDRRDPTS